MRSDHNIGSLLTPGGSCIECDYPDTDHMLRGGVNVASAIYIEAACCPLQTGCCLHYICYSLFSNVNIDPEYNVHCRDTV